METITWFFDYLSIYFDIDPFLTHVKPKMMVKCRTPEHHCWFKILNAAIMLGVIKLL